MEQRTSEDCQKRVVSFSYVSAETDLGELTRRGVNEARLVLCSNDRIYVVKTNKHQRQLGNELLAHELACQFRVGTPDCAIVSVGKLFGEKFPTTVAHFPPGSYFGSHSDPFYQTPNGTREDIQAGVFGSVDALYDLLAFDYLIFNNDRKLDDILVRAPPSEKGEILAIDHERAFTGHSWTAVDLRRRSDDLIDVGARWLFHGFDGDGEKVKAAKLIRSRAENIGAVIRAISEAVGISLSDINALEQFVRQRLELLESLVLKI